MAQLTRNKSLPHQLTCNKVRVVKLADRIGLVPGDSVPEVAVEHRKPLLRQHPRVADVHLHTFRKNIFKTRYYKVLYSMTASSCPSVYPQPTSKTFRAAI